MDKLTIEVIRGFQGDMATYQAQIKPDQILQILAHDPRSNKRKTCPENIRELYDVAQRETKSTRIDLLRLYIENRIVGKGVVDGAIPAVSIGFLSPLTFTAARGMENIGTVDISRQTLVRIVFDGPGRLSTMIEMLEKGVKGVNKIDIPVTLFCPKRGKMSDQGLGQLFYDFNMLSSKVTAAQARGKDIASPHSQLGRWMKQLPLFASLEHTKNGFTEEKLVRFTRNAVDGMAVGNGLNHIIRAPVLNGNNLPEYKAAFEIFWTRMQSKLDNKLFMEEHSIMPFQAAYASISSTLFKLETGKLNGANRKTIERYADALASIDWGKSNPDWVGVCGNMIAGELRMTGGAGTAPTFEYVWDKVSTYLSGH